MLSGIPNPQQLPPGTPVVIEEGTILSAEEIKIRGWRFEELQREGYDEDAARRIACRSYIDLHKACELLASGCSQELALQILL